MAVGGVKGGVSHGATDEFGFEAVENKATLGEISNALRAVFDEF